VLRQHRTIAHNDDRRHHRTSAEHRGSTPDIDIRLDAHRLRQTVERHVGIVGNLTIIERSRMRVVPQSRRRVAIAQPGPSLDDLALADQTCSNTVAETVKGRVSHTNSTPETPESMSQPISTQIRLAQQARREKPVRHQLRPEPFPPGKMGIDQPGRRSPKRQTPRPARPRRSQHPMRQTPLDSQNPAIKIAVTQHR